MEMKWDIQQDVQEFKGQSTMQLHFKAFAEHPTLKHRQNAFAAPASPSQAQGDDW